MLTYPFDHTIFPVSPSPLAPPCRTCLLPKPARSKHCAICRACIQKADHHCVWINNCVGRNNYVYFLALMLSVSLLLAYGAWLGYRILHVQIGLAVVSRSPSPHSTLTPHTQASWSRSLSWRLYASRFGEIIAVQPFVAAPALLAGLSFPLAAGLSLYHVYLIWAGMTTNESGKWADLRDDIAEGRVWRARVEELDGDFPGLEGQPLKGGGDWPLRPSWVVVTMEEAGRRPRVKRRRPVQDGVGRPGREAEGEGDDSHANTMMNGHAAGVVDTAGPNDPWREDERWIPVRSLAEIDNIYDLGFWDNLRDVVWNRE